MKDNNNQKENKAADMQTEPDAKNMKAFHEGFTSYMGLTMFWRPLW